MIDMAPVSFTLMLPMAPGVELTLGNSLIPITGVVLLVMALVQGDFADALRYFIPVCGVTLICCHLAIRWAVYQFNQESVLFRESERLDPRRWLVQLIRDREDTPSLAEGFVCVVLIFVVKFFMEVAMAANAPAEKSFNYLVTVVFVSQVVCIALPADDGDDFAVADGVSSVALVERYRLVTRRGHDLVRVLPLDTPPSCTTSQPDGRRCCR